MAPNLRLRDGSTRRYGFEGGIYPHMKHAKHAKRAKRAKELQKELDCSEVF